MIRSRMGRVACGVAVTAVIAASGCAELAGEPRPVSSLGAAPESTSRPATASIGDLDLCTLLTPADLPVQPGPDGRTEHEPEWEGERCASSVQLANPFDLMISGVQRHHIAFEDYTPIDGATGEYVDIDGRQAWVGRASSDVKACGAVFGAADGTLVVTLTDETQRGVDACQTVRQLASTVISRTPPPTG